MDNSTLMGRLAFQTQADVPLQLVHVLHPNCPNLTWCPAHTRKPLPCALRGSREMAPKTITNCPILDRDAMRPLSPADSTGEAVKPLLRASKDLQEM